MEKVKFYLADDQYLSRVGLKTFLKSHETFDVIGDANAFPLDWSGSLNDVDVLVVDYQSEAGQSQVLQRIEQLIHNVNVLVISDELDPVVLNKLLAIGLRGYLTKSCSEQEVLDAIYALISGKKFYCNKILELLVDQQQQEPIAGLSSREIEVLRLLALGKTTKQIAQELFLSVHTINSHRKNMLKKLEFKSPAQLIAYAISKFN